MLIQRDENVKYNFPRYHSFSSFTDALLMQTHLNSVTGVPVCPYWLISRQPLRGEFCKFSPMSCTTRHLSLGRKYCVLFHIPAFFFKKYSITKKNVCQHFFLHLFMIDRGIFFWAQCFLSSNCNESITQLHKDCRN